MVLLPFLVHLGTILLVAIVVASIRDLAVDWIDVKDLNIDAHPRTLAGNMTRWDIDVTFKLKDDSWFFGNIFGPRRIMSWRIVVEPDPQAVSNNWVQPNNVVKQGARTRFAYINETFTHTWDVHPGLHGSNVRIFVRNKEIVNQRFTFVRMN